MICDFFFFFWISLYSCFFWFVFALLSSSNLHLYPYEKKRDFADHFLFYKYNKPKKKKLEKFYITNDLNRCARIHKQFSLLYLNWNKNNEISNSFTFYIFICYIISLIIRRQYRYVQTRLKLPREINNKRKNNNITRTRKHLLFSYLTISNLFLFSFTPLLSTFISIF
jgi:hypothetical protein